MLGCSLSEAWGNPVERFTNSPKNDENKESKEEKFIELKQRVRIDKAKFENDTDTDTDIDDHDNHDNHINHEEKFKIDSDFFSDSDGENTEYIPKYNSNSTSILNRDNSINELYTQFNNLEETVNKVLNMVTDKFTVNENESSDSKNIYDIVLFVIFGLFVLLILESISKLVLRYAKPAIN